MRYSTNQQRHRREPKLSLKKRILRYLRNKRAWVHKGHIETLAKQAGYLGETSGRICRSLAEEGLVEVRQVRGSDEYRAAPPDRVERYIVKGQGVGGVDKKLEVPVYD